LMDQVGRVARDGDFDVKEVHEIAGQYFLTAGSSAGAIYYIAK
jgi:hypothetical protein